MLDSRLEIMEADAFTEALIAKLRNHPKRIVFSDGCDDRVLKVAEEMVRLEVGVPILLGPKKEILAKAEELGIDMTFVKVLEPAVASDLPLFCERLRRIQRFKGVELANACEVVAQPHHFASMMIQYGQADAMVGGNLSLPAAVFRAVLHMVKPDPSVPKAFSVAVLSAPHLKHFGPAGVLYLADSGMIPDPNVEELAAIAEKTGLLARHNLGRRPRVAMLSHSTLGSAGTDSARKVVAATELAKQRVSGIEIEIDGEIQVDVALDAAAAEIKVPGLAAKETADVLVFPNLDAAHIAMKLLHHVAGARVYGQLILGLARPAAQVTRTVDATSLLGTALAVGLEAVKFHELYPDGEMP
jgi:phosphate acetyltransferase